MANAKVPSTIGRLLIDDEYCDIYTIEQVNEILAKLPQGIRRATENKIIAFQHLEEEKEKLNLIESKHSMYICNWKSYKEKFSAAPDRKAYISSREDVILQRQKVLEAKVLFMKAEANEIQMDNNFTALKKIYQTFADDNNRLERMQR
jgi:hypothetical protein|nr:MAG TPA: hypothetical protein [Caudoviricetes sp.]DAJ43103.1 MAG TPA: hypothetical protein [Caudoviricetes sp.]DAX72822.1 MAG TPA: hypothetical protein [Caudoviricetes sp.]